MYCWDSRVRVQKLHLSLLPVGAIGLKATCPLFAEQTGLLYPGDQNHTSRHRWQNICCICVFMCFHNCITFVFSSFWPIWLPKLSIFNIFAVRTHCGPLLIQRSALPGILVSLVKLSANFIVLFKERKEWTWMNIHGNCFSCKCSSTSSFIRGSSMAAKFATTGYFAIFAASCRQNIGKIQ